MYRKSRNSRVVRGWSVGAKGMVTQGLNWHQSWNQIQTLHECLCCPICYAHLGTPWHRTVISSRADSNSESRYPPRVSFNSRCRGRLKCDRRRKGSVVQILSVPWSFSILSDKTLVPAKPGFCGTNLQSTSTPHFVLGSDPCGFVSGCSVLSCTYYRFEGIYGQIAR